MLIGIACHVKKTGDHKMSEANEILRAVDALASKLGLAADELIEAYMSAAQYEIFDFIWVTFMFFIFMAALIIIWKKYHLEKEIARVTEKIYFDDGLYISSIVVIAVFFFFSLLAIGLNLKSLLIAINEPRAWAILQIVKVLE